MRYVLNLVKRLRRSPPFERRIFGRWWRRQSPARQDRYATLAPLASVLLFLAAIISAFWYLRNEEFQRAGDSVRRDAEVAQQHIRLRLIENEEQLGRIAQELVVHRPDRNMFLRNAADLIREHPEISRIYWLDTDRSVVATQSAHGYRIDNDPAVVAEQQGNSLPHEGTDSAPENAFRTARKTRDAVYSAAFTDNAQTKVLQVHVPLMVRSVFLGMLVAEYPVDNLLRVLVPNDVSARHAISLIDPAGRLLASTVMLMPGQDLRAATISHDVPVLPSGNALMLRGQGYRTSVGLVGNTLFWMVVALSFLTVWTLLITWRHMRRRSQMQAALVSEANFRRAPRNSPST